VLVFFFTTVGCGMDFRALGESWPMACALCAARLLALWAGHTASAAATPSAPATVRAPYGWLGFITQAGISLGLAQEVGELFPGWGERLSTALIAAIVRLEIAVDF
jgi:Kef-type K+ transport system membrane component KefB